jgi:hypothetical protein
LAALVDVQGDEDYAQSRGIDFEGELLRKAAPALLIAARAFVEADQLAEQCSEGKWKTWRTPSRSPAMRLPRHPQLVSSAMLRRHTLMNNHQRERNLA